MSEHKDEQKKALTNNEVNVSAQSGMVEGAEGPAQGESTPIAAQGDEDKAGHSSSADTADAAKEAKLKAAAEARAARAAAKAAKEAEEAQGAEAAAPKPPSPMQPQLDRITALLRSDAGSEAVAEAYINELNGDMPTIIVNGANWFTAARLLKNHEDMRYDYLRNVSGVDYETYMEVVYHLVNLSDRRVVTVKVRTDRESPSVDSVTSIWSTANWNEREIYDLLGIYFPGHPDLRRIMMPDDWDGHPLRKDYVPLDSEV